MDNYAFLNANDPAVIDALYQQFKEDPSQLDPELKRFFEGFDFASKSYKKQPSDAQPVTSKEFKVLGLIDDYRKRGHLFTATNPVRKRRTYKPSLEIENFGLTKADLDTIFQAGNEVGIGAASLRDIIEMLEQTYCKSVGVEYVYVRNTELVKWLREKMERIRNTPQYPVSDKKYILQKLYRAVNFEGFLHKKFPGQKRFSLEGAESLIPALEAIMEKGSELGVKEFVIGMAHRGRLNVLANVMRKPYADIFSEFEGKVYEDETLLGDVKYHLGYTAERKTTRNKIVKLTLAPNPSHLEAVDPVVQGIARAKIDLLYQGDYNKVTPILIHGDASVSGQGIIYEIAQMSELNGYRTGGTVHLVINNQIGFTTDYLDGRSSTYSTDVAKVTQSPVFHVNGDDPEAVVYAIQLAMEFREKYHKDIYIDLLCYRKYGHNEGDEPRFTQPILYKAIEKHPNPKIIYEQKLISEGILTAEQIKEMEDHNFVRLEESLTGSKSREKSFINNFLADTWQGITKAKSEDFEKSPATGISKQSLVHIAKRLTDLPEDKQFFRKTIRLQKQRAEMVFETGQLDWAMGELLAYGSLVSENLPVRLSGQDVERGTFSHRHAVLRVEDSEEKYVPLNAIADDQATFDVYNSLLSEYGVLGFDYGYALASPNTLTIWEAQFGDFNNGAQIIFDQFLSSAEDKWNVMNDLVVLLPHGYEGQGPEHSSARIERFLSLCAENNIQVANCTTPANFFHILRRQLKRPFRKPLVIFTPKSLLRHPKCVSPLEDFYTKTSFKEVIDDPIADPDRIEKVIFCSGKVYYDLEEAKAEKNKDSIAIVRLEQLYPLPRKQMMAIINRYHNAKTHLWVQEEPINMGPWKYIHHEFKEIPLRLIARPPSGSPATGSPKFHAIRQQKIIDKALEVCDCPYVNKECGMLCIGNKWRSFEKELDDLNVDQIDSKFHNATKKLE
ncbi:MAG: 2-oxoglutarate dehydrogenase E1 component [Bacteroidetes bacterium]|nr:2-oxoglutarate dehydrogenase E1 component [Bacteroidota bacterium]MBU1578550.1 2-oxoglutarate dehydrogenase E1 component [Bacteroidota bacterium]MBU2559107.1 2-oxoglutarate dehydrogenase E1 component [Bacteroidota bacterium]